MPRRRQLDLKKSLAERIRKWRGKTTVNANGCWLYGGNVSDKGYALVRFGKKIEKLHRISASYYLGLDLDSKEQALHKTICPSKRCWNPEHLYLGSIEDNRNDMIEMGTFNWLSQNRKT